MSDFMLLRATKEYIYMMTPECGMRSLPVKRRRFAHVQRLVQHSQRPAPADS